MSLIFTVSPDFNTKYLPGWFVVNTLLQRLTGEGIHLETFDDFDGLHEAIRKDQIDLIYANPFDAARLVRDHRFVALARPHGRPDEAVVAAHVNSAVQSVESLRPGTRIASTDNPDVHMMGMIMLEPADLSPANVQIQQRPSFVLVAKSLLSGEADVGFFLAETFDELSDTVRHRLRVLVRSQIYMISHLFLVHPRVADLAPALRRSLLLMDATGAYHRQMMQQYEGRANAAHIITPLMRLQDASMTRVIIVTLPEATPVIQAAALQEDLRRAHVEPWAWVINRSMAATGTRDPLLRARLGVERRQIQRVVGELSGRTFVLPWLATPPVGLQALQAIVRSQAAPTQSASV